MAITFKKRIRKQRNLIFVFLVLVSIIILIVWRSQFFKEEPSTEFATGFKEIKLDFEIFENSFFKELQPIEKVPDFKGELGRENPFIP